MAEAMSEEEFARRLDKAAPMTDAALAEIKAHSGQYGLGDATDIIGELLDEVDRLCGEIARGNQEIETLNHELEVEREQQREANDEADQLRAQLAEIGETKAEWAADGPAGWMQDPTGFDSERFARNIVEQAAEQGVAVKLMRRLAGAWCEVPNA